MVYLTQFIGLSKADAEAMIRRMGYQVTYRFIGPSIVSTRDLKTGRLNLVLDPANAVITNAYFE